jgi:hypothetical protein
VFEFMSAIWVDWWVLLLAANGVTVWLLSMALVFGAAAGPVADTPEMTSLEGFVRRWARVRGSVFAPRRAPLPFGARTAEFVASFRPLAEDMWRANRGAFLPARILTRLGLLIGAAQLLLVFFVWAPRLGDAGWVFLAMSIFGVDLLFGVIALMSESERWRRRAPFEAQLVHASLAALMRPKKRLPWSEARSRLARIERVLANRFARATDRPATQHHRDTLWWPRVAEWGAELAELDLQVRLPGGNFGRVVTDQVDAAHRAIASTSTRRKRRLAGAQPETKGLDPQARAGWILIAICGGAVALFAAFAAIDFMRSTQTPFPSLTEVRAWAPAVGAMMTAISLVVGAIAWAIRRLSGR